MLHDLLSRKLNFTYKYKNSDLLFWMTIYYVVESHTFLSFNLFLKFILIMFLLQ